MSLRNVNFRQNINSWFSLGKLWKVFMYLQVEGTAVGFMSISDDVNTDMLNECFELGPFHGLKKPHPDDDLIPPKTPSPSPPPGMSNLQTLLQVCQTYKSSSRYIRLSSPPPGMSNLQVLLQVCQTYKSSSRYVKLTSHPPDMSNLQVLLQVYKTY